MQLRRRCISPVLGLLFFLPFSALACQQTSSGAQHARGDETADKVAPVKVNTRLVIVDVVARDKKGNPLTDLQTSDLRILEDGKEQQIKTFTFYKPSLVPSTKDDAAFVPADLPSNHFGNAPRFAPDLALNIVLLDSLNSNLLNQAYVRTEMIKFLEKLPQGQPVAIFTLGKKLQLLQDFTTDQTTLKRTIQAFKGESPVLSQNSVGTTEVSVSPTGLAAQVLMSDPSTAVFLAKIQDFAEDSVNDQSDMRIQYTFAALNSLGKVLSHYRGRKNLIWISESVPMNIFSDFQTITRINPNAPKGTGVQLGQNTGFKRDHQFGNQLAELANLLADAQVAVYPIDARGLIGSPLYNVANNLAGQGGVGLGGLNMKAEGKQAEELFQSHASMLDIADKTGGQAYYNRNDIDNALSDGISDGSTYYTVGYYPQNKKWDGRFRKIEVKTNRSGAHLRYRTGYFALDRDAYAARHPEQSDKDFSQALSFDSPVNTAVQFRAAVLPPSSTSSTLVLRFTVDPQSINFTLGPDGMQHARVDCAARVYDREKPDKVVKTEATKVEAVLMPEVYEKIVHSFFPCELKMDVPPGLYSLRLGVRDKTTDKIGTANAEVIMPVQSSTADNKR